MENAQLVTWLITKYIFKAGSIQAKTIVQRSPRKFETTVPLNFTWTKLGIANDISTDIEPKSVSDDLQRKISSAFFVCVSFNLSELFTRDKKTSLCKFW